MAIEKLGNLCGQHQARKKWIHIDPKPPAHDACGTRRYDGGLLNPIKMRSDFLVKASSFVCERHGACSALKKPHADACFQPPDRPSDARRRETQRLGRAGHRTSLDDGHQDRHTGKKASVIGHGKLLTPSPKCTDT